MMKRSHGYGGSYIKTLLRDTKNAALEGGALSDHLGPSSIMASLITRPAASENDAAGTGRRESRLLREPAMHKDFFMGRAGFEPATLCLKGRYSTS